MDTVPLRTFEELSTKHKILEGRMTELRQRLAEMHGIKEEHASLVAAKPKFQSKILELSESVKDLKAQLKDATQDQSTVEDLQSQMELLSVDKEVAEEERDQVAMERDDLKERLAEQAVEVGVLQEALQRWEKKVDGGEEVQEDGQAGEGGGDKTLKVLQLERQNERLKEALGR